MDDAGERHYVADFRLGRRQRTAHASEFGGHYISLLRVYLDVSENCTRDISTLIPQFSYDESITDENTHVLDANALHVVLDICIGGAYLVHHAQHELYSVSVVQVGQVYPPRNVYSPN